MMYNLPDMNPGPRETVRVCPTCSRPVVRQQVSVPKGLIHGMAFRWFCSSCRKFVHPLSK